jgi:hypothetical protein
MQVEMLVMQTRDRVDNIERMHEQLLASEKAFKERIEGKPTEAASAKAPAQAAPEAEAAAPAQVAADAKADDTPEEAKEESTESQVTRQR